MNTLLVEDHTDTRTVLSNLLGRCGCRIVSAKNIEEARKRLNEMPFSVLICDLNLPDGDGIDLLREAKKTHSLTAIALTGRNSDCDRSRGLEAGVDIYLTKPIDFHKLRQAIAGIPKPQKPLGV